MKRMFLLVGVLTLLCTLAALTYAQTLTHGPVVGAVTTNSAAFVYRVSAEADLQIQLSTDPLFGTSLYSTTFHTVADSDFFGKMTVSDLTANTLYYYRPVINGVPLADGIERTFRTFPAADGGDFTFLVGSCQQAPSFDPNSRIGTIYNEMANIPDARFMIQQGDWGYPDTTDSETGQPENFYSLHWDLIQSAFRSHYTPDYPMINLLRRMPVAYTYDDHDMLNDNSDHFNSPWAAVQNIIRGSQSFFPNYTLVNPDAGVWHKFRCGDAEVFMTDNRAQRSPNIVGFSYTVAGPETTWTFNPPTTKQILDGDPAVISSQMDWLFESLLNSTATWKFVSTGTMFNPGARAAIELPLLLQHTAYDPITLPGLGTVPIYQVAVEFADKWAGFPESIRRLIQFVADNNIQNVILLTGDSHNSAIDNGANSIFPELMTSGLDISNSHEVAIFQQFGINIWNRGGHTMDRPESEFRDSYGRVTVYGTDSVKLEVVDEGDLVIGQHTVAAGFLPDRVNLLAAPYGIDFGSVPLCRAPAVQAFVTISTSCDPLHVQNITSTDPHFMLVPGYPTEFTLESGHSQVVPVLYFPTGAEVNQGALVIFSNDPQSPQLVYLQGQGVLADTCEIPAGAYRTESHGGWGQECHGGNIGCLRDANFAAVFPTGLTVGNGNTLTLTSSAAVAALLPSGGRAGTLTMSYTDPSTTSAGRFAGLVVALAINVAFGDAAVAGFADIGSFVIASGPFQNYTVDALLSLANTVLGGNLAALPDGITLTQLCDAVASVNENFEAGNVSRGYLLNPCCDPAPLAQSLTAAKIAPPTQSIAAAPGTLNVSNYPNPFNPTTQISFDLTEAGMVSLKVYNILGEEVAMLANSTMQNGRHTVEFNAQQLPSGIYIYRLQAAGQEVTRKMLLMK